MPTDLVTESNSINSRSDNRAVSNAFSNEAWDCMDKNGRKANCAVPNETLSLGAKAVGGVASGAASRADSLSQIIGKELNFDVLDKMGSVQPGTELEKQRAIGNDGKEQRKEKDQKNEAKQKDDCLDLNITIKGFPSHESDPRKTQEPIHPDGGHGQGGGKGNSHGRIIGREHVPPSSKIDQEYGAWTDKLEEKN